MQVKVLTMRQSHRSKIGALLGGFSDWLSSDPQAPLTDALAKAISKIQTAIPIDASLLEACLEEESEYDGWHHQPISYRLIDNDGNLLWQGQTASRYRLPRRSVCIQRAPVAGANWKHDDRLQKPLDPEKGDGHQSDPIDAAIERAMSENVACFLAALEADYKKQAL